MRSLFKAVTLSQSQKQRPGFSAQCLGSALKCCEQLRQRQVNPTQRLDRLWMLPPALSFTIVPLQCPGILTVSIFPYLWGGAVERCSPWLSDSISLASVPLSGSKRLSLHHYCLIVLPFPRGLNPGLL